MHARVMTAMNQLMRDCCEKVKKCDKSEMRRTKPDEVGRSKRSTNAPSGDTGI